MHAKTFPWCGRGFIINKTYTSLQPPPLELCRTVTTGIPGNSLRPPEFRADEYFKIILHIIFIYIYILYMRIYIYHHHPARAHLVYTAGRSHTRLVLFADQHCCMLQSFGRRRRLHNCWSLRACIYRWIVGNPLTQVGGAPTLANYMYVYTVQWGP